MHALSIALRLALSLGLVAYMVFGVCTALRTGVANAAGTLRTRKDNAAAFWGLIAVQGSLAIASAFVFFEVVRALMG